jgi:hypothetical protein
MLEKAQGADMGLLPNPWVLLGALALIVSSYFYGHHEGYAQKEGEDAIVIGHKNQQMSDAKEKADAELKQAQDKLAATQKQYRDAIRSGNERLYVRIATPVGCASTGDSTTSAQLDPTFADALVSITDDGDKAITDLNACIDQYNKMRGIVNGDK